MKQLLILILAGLVSCGSPQQAEHNDSTNPGNHDHTIATVPMNGAEKWKADEATKKNVAAMMRVVSNDAYADEGKRAELITDLRPEIDALVKECTMKGPEHDALHVWLEKVVEDVKTLKDEHNEYADAYLVLKRDVASFYEAFE